MNNNTRQYRVKPDVMLLAFSLILLPHYIFPSGAFQPVDFIIAISSIYVVFTLTHDELSNAIRLVSPSIPFLCWIIGVNTYYIITSGHVASYLLATIQLVYALVILAVYQIILMRIMNLQEGHIYLLICMVLLVISPLFINLGGYDLTADMLYRKTLSFNNPNQLGYFALLSLSMLLIYALLYRKKLHFKNIYIQAGCLFVLLLTNWFGIISLSRGAIVGIILLDLTIFILFFRKSFLLVFSVVVLCFFLDTLHFPKEGNNSFFNGSLKRLSYEGFYEKDDLLHRTIQQMSHDSDISIIFGNGPLRSYKSGLIPINKMFKGEVHNSLAGIFNQYGLCGLILLGIGLCIYLGRVQLSFPNVMIFASFTLYNMCHYGLRFRLLWIVLAFMSADFVINRKISLQNQPNAIH